MNRSVNAAKWTLFRTVSIVKKPAISNKKDYPVRNKNGFSDHAGI